MEKQEERRKIKNKGRVRWSKRKRHYDIKKLRMELKRRKK